MTLKKVEIFLEAMALYNESLSMDDLSYNYELKAINKTIGATYKDVLSELFLCEKEELNAKLIELDDWNVAVGSCVSYWMFDALISNYGMLKIQNESNNYTEQFANDYRGFKDGNIQEIEIVNNANYKSNALTSNFLKSLSEDIVNKNPKAFLIENSPNVYLELCYSNILIETDDRYILLHFGFND